MPIIRQVRGRTCLALGANPVSRGLLPERGLSGGV